ncbi:MAG TPA: tRNA (adenosine(37)-N6)-threonylcarbamoyltransferase complex dimerization subunit type 1 TsaB [Stellaceae bacterium]|nr:tRNA (adenosine(37)-N6)-threonylcarbamoyltransferase complex dimerization subunit type 1 TsaB [Stellaceae bacterium]
MSETRAPVILAFDTAGSACSVAVGRGDVVLTHERREMRHGHAEALLPMIDRVMAAAGCVPRDIGTIAVTIGPGGFTGIRAGLAAAHGLALATGARLAGVSGFAAVAGLIAPDGLPLLVALDSRREDFYAQLFDKGLAPIGDPAAIAPDDLSAWVGHGEIAIAGDAAEGAMAALANREGVRPVSNSAPDALGVLGALRRWPERADPAARPLYLHPPDVSFPKARRDQGKMP